MARVLASARPRLNRASAVAVAGGVAMALGALLPWYVAVGTGAEAGAFAAGRGVLATGILAAGVIVAASSIVGLPKAWLAALIGSLTTLAFGVLAAGGAGEGLRRAGVEPGAMPLGQHPGMGVNLLLGGAVVALAGAVLLWRERR